MLARSRVLSRATDHRHGVAANPSDEHEPRAPLLILFAMLAFVSNSRLCRWHGAETAIDAASFTAPGSPRARSSCSSSYGGAASA